MDLNVDWEERWRLGNTQWDYGVPSPALVKLVEEEETKKLIPSSGVGIVPGCGYDVQFLATPTLRMIGLDNSKTAIETCHKIHPDAAAHNYEFQEVDFFNYDFPADGYDLAYDYTFFCALHPTYRETWAKRYSELVKPGGTLVCLMFPLHDKEGGPPYRVTVEA
ncbi:S-adenosyl-L-methionine-dependent methyltransferase [Hesseltinella vesiculosa]|uniref:S-adenosyl-L-methionine-dependent methyltransferase n=1 Tax=Hesseltinella vesiculosa TaxID=101127 RepID=A0A1X2GU55_9FUNG|nr:S-adenosyl-L-methionine-dependent methyltransferase [Hesseltinella vesiculosa]